MIERLLKKKEIIFFVLVVLIIFGAFIISYFSDEKNIDILSIIFSYLSAVFAFLSALGIITTISVYLLQKHDIETEKNKKIKIINSIIAKECKRTYWLIECISNFISSLYNTNERLEKYTNKDYNYDKINISVNNTNKLYYITITSLILNDLYKDDSHDSMMSIVKIDEDKLSELLYASASLEADTYESVNDLISVIKESNHLLNYILEFNKLSSFGGVDRFIENGQAELSDQIETLKKIYFKCTNENLEEKDWIIR